MRLHQKTHRPCLPHTKLPAMLWPKHYFEGAGRIVSKLGTGKFVQPLGITAGGQNYTAMSLAQMQAQEDYIKSLGLPPGPPTQQGIYASPEFTKNPNASGDYKDILQDQEPPEGWPRYPIFNEPGDVPGPPIQYGPPVKPLDAVAGMGFVGNKQAENDVFFYHPDHLGSTSYITSKSGEVSQHVEYIAFGEILFEEHSSSVQMPYLFNGKELDRETNLSYFGARYLDMKTSLWLNVDPLVEKTMEAYGYCYGNPIKLVDPDGKDPGPAFGYRMGASLSFGSGGFAFNLTASVGFQHKDSFTHMSAFATGSAYMGGNQLGTSSMTKGVQWDATLTAMVTIGGGKGQSHNMYSVNYNTSSPFSNDFAYSGTYGQALSYNSAINSKWDDSYGNKIQRSGIIALKVGNFSLQTSNDTGKIGGDGGDRANTGAGVLNFGGLEVGYQNFTGAYNRNQEPEFGGGCSYPSIYKQDDYQQSLNQSFYFLRKDGVSLEGGPNNGGVQNFIHSKTNTGLFLYPKNDRLNGALTIEKTGN